MLTVDRFGNLVTNIDRKTFEGFAKQGEFRILAGGTPVGRLVSTYAEIPSGEVCALFGSSDHLELAANAVSAADRLGLARHAVVEISRELSQGSRLGARRLGRACRSNPGSISKAHPRAMSP